jgi:hypothetical protein
MGAYTPGPWNVDYSASEFGSWGIMGRADPNIPGNWLKRVAEVDADSSEDPEAEANAILIAAAPDLLTALKCLLDPDAENDIQQAINAIAKAEGREI